MKRKWNKQVREEYYGVPEKEMILNVCRELYGNEFKLKEVVKIKWQTSVTEFIPKYAII